MSVVHCPVFFEDLKNELSFYNKINLLLTNLCTPIMVTTNGCGGRMGTGGKKKKKINEKKEPAQERI